MAQSRADHVALFSEPARAFHHTLVHDLGLAAHDGAAVALQGMSLEAYPGGAIALERTNVEGVQRRGLRTGVNPHLYRRYAKLRQCAPLFTAHDHLVGLVLHRSGPAVIDQAIGGPVETAAGLRCVQGAVEFLTQLLAQFDSPLVEGVDVPEDTLHEYLMLVDGDQAAQVARTQALQQQRGAWLVAGDDLMRCQRLRLLPVHALSQ